MITPLGINTPEFKAITAGLPDGTPVIVRLGFQSGPESLQTREGFVTTAEIVDGKLVLTAEEPEL